MIDWILRTSPSVEKYEIQWTARMQMDDLDFADDLFLLSNTQQQMQGNMTSVAAASASVDLSIHKGKIDGEALESIKSLTYVGSIIDEHGGSADVNVQISKARAASICNCRTSGTQNNCCQPTPVSEFSIQISKQFYCMIWKRGQLRIPSSRRYEYLSTIVYTKYSCSVCLTLSATTYYGREHTRFQRRKE
ncbi:unnamed protein product [Schistosoma margrebowiei]|uniref:Uncharacterized protein n=1 Tax=Schistosoma margrebowiei TaxID=48269 RepID=A0A183N0D2_9TREM|nr:unnamed protein product [Schistosoma margrebowiei]